jgi:hypothetical protein
MWYSGAGGKLISEKNQKQKILWHCPFKGLEEAVATEPTVAIIISLNQWLPFLQEWRGL